MYVVFGKNTPFAAGIALSTLNGSNGVRFDGASAGDLAGFSVAAAGDINGDGRDDLVVGARFANTNGSSYVVFGRSTPFPATFALSALSGTDGFRLDGGAGINSSGFTVSPAGDINGDGRSDLLIGSTSGAHVVFGRSTAFSATLALSALSGSDGFRIADAGGFSGSAVAAAGDVNGDHQLKYVCANNDRDPVFPSRSLHGLVHFVRHNPVASAKLGSHLPYYPNSMTSLFL